MDHSRRSMANVAWLALWALVPVFAAQPLTAAAQEPRQQDDKKSPSFMRLSGADDAPQSLEVGITRYARDGVIIDLVPAVHVGEQQYYETLNEVFRSYDVVLYELVAAEENRIPDPDGSRSFHPVSLLQESMRAWLGLESQLEQIDYRAGNFRHADLSPDELAQRMRSRGETGWSLAIDALSQMSNRAEAQTEAGAADFNFDQMLELLSDPMAARRFLARQFSNTDALDAGLGPKLNQLIVTDRNEAAMKVLEDELENGSRRIALFYGAAHMPDFDERLRDAGFRQQAQSWLEAWDLQQSAAAAPGGLPNLLEMFKRLESGVN